MMVLFEETFCIELRLMVLPILMMYVLLDVAYVLRADAEVTLTVVPPAPPVVPPFMLAYPTGLDSAACTAVPVPAWTTRAAVARETAPASRDDLIMETSKEREKVFLASPRPCPMPRGY